MTEGFVYILTNEAMPGYIKIGLTKQNDVAKRVKQLDTTATPLPFECYFAARVPDCARLERTLHFVFGDKRARTNREFFTADRDVVKAIIELVALKDVSPSDAEQAITPAQRLEINAVRSSEPRTLSGLGIAPGTVLTFTKDETITCQVVGDRTVEFRGDVMSLSRAAINAVQSLGYKWQTVAGFNYWALGGVKLSDMPMLPTEEP
jgi:hypothetical protein